MTRGYGISAQKLYNRGRPRPLIIGAEYRDCFKQVVFKFCNRIKRYEASYFATFTPGRDDVVLYPSEGQVSQVLRLTELAYPGGPLDEVTDAVADAFGAIATITFQTRVYA